jgi:hypothetical protein
MIDHEEPTPCPAHHYGSQAKAPSFLERVKQLEAPLEDANPQPNIQAE